MQRREKASGGKTYVIYGNKLGRTFKLAGKQVANDKKLKIKTHRPVIYESTNPKIASVSRKSAITGKKKGICYVHAYAHIVREVKMRKRFITILLATVMIVTVAAPAAFASSNTVKMTTYDVFKNGNTVYCPSAGNGIYKVTVKNGKVKKIKWLRRSDFVQGNYSYIGSMKKKGNYLYYVEFSEGTYCTFNRINLKTGKTKQLAENGTDYAFKNKKIYVEMWEFDDYSDYAYYMSMKLDGTSKKETSVKPKMITKKSNAKGYSVVYKEKGDYVYTYLKTPEGKFKLGKSKYKI